MTTTAQHLRQSLRAWANSDLDPPGPAWLQWLWTLLFCAAIALGFTVLGVANSAGRAGGSWLDPGIWWRWYRVNFVVSLCIGILIHTLFAVLIPAVGRARIREFSHGKRAAFFVAIPMAGVAVGWPLGLWLVSQGSGWVRLPAPGQLVPSALMALGLSFIIFLIFNARALQVHAEKRALEAQLRLLQAQMEPHFLFNTLANVATLIDYEPAKARQMLESFTDYLRSSLGNLRHEHSSVGAELDLARTYLALMQHRMDDRLRFQINCPDALRTQPLPPLLLQPLVENAIHHGLEPKVEGGCVTVSVERDGDQLVLKVADDGLGQDAARPGRRTGNGVALDNLRQRLAARHGAAARLELAAAEPGTVATLRLPMSPA